MKVIDIVKPAPKTNLELHKWWKNRLTTEFILKYGKAIKVNYVPVAPVIFASTTSHNWFVAQMKVRYGNNWKEQQDNE